MPSGATTYTIGAGNREDLTDILSRITPEETPLFAYCGRGEAAKATYHEWQLDQLETANTEGVVEGSDNSTFANHAEDRARAGNYTQIVRRNYLVSKTQQAVRVAGVKSELSEAIAKKMIEAKLDIDATISSGNDRNAGGGGVARQLRGIFSWISSSGPSDLNSNYRTPSGSIVSGSSAITESQFLAICQSIWTVGGKVDTFMVGPTLKRTLSAFVGRTASGAGITEDSTAKKIVNSVSLYETDFGLCKFVPSRNLNGTTTPGLVTANHNDGVFISKDQIRISWLRPLAHEPLVDLGGGPRGMVEGEYTLEVINPRALGKHENTA